MDQVLARVFLWEAVRPGKIRVSEVSTKTPPLVPSALRDTLG
jgi:hypothetical protein